MTAGASIEGNVLNVENTYVGDKIVLIATTEREITTTIELDVIDKIEANISLAWSNNESSGFEQVTTTNNTFSLVPNLPEGSTVWNPPLLNLHTLLPVQSP